MSENNTENNYKQEVMAMLKKQSNKDISGLMKDIMKDKIEKTKDLSEVNKFFSELYDDLYYDIIFKKIKIDKRTSRLLEDLAMPIDRKTDKGWQDLLDKIKRS
ncbi:MAG: hypothetical protein WCG25_05310 [bacterium]